MQIILGSQSPRRRELLQYVLGDFPLTVLPPRVADEPGFEGFTTAAEIEQQLLHVVRGKSADVSRQLSSLNCEESPCVICADTIVVASAPSGDLIVLGKPPDDDWQRVTADWFRTYYADRPHAVWTGCRIESATETEEFIVKTTVRMCKLSEPLIDWYVSTGECVGKAGGYGIQGKAAVLIDGLDGSLSNVIGLPVAEVLDALQRLNVWSPQTGAE